MRLFGLKSVAVAASITFISLGSSGLTSSFAGPAETRSTTSRIQIHPESKNLSGRYGYVLMDAQTGEILVERNADKRFIPASLSKIPTMLMALNALGTDHRFETKLLADGRIDGGVLHGNLHLVGAGDPTLKTRDLVELANTLAAQGISRITGDFTFNTDALPRSSVIDKAQPADHHYNPAISGLNLDLNLRRVNGTKRKVGFPGYRTARILGSAAAQRGITLPLPKHFAGAAPGTVIASHFSAPVSEIAKTMMKRSTNLTAEALGALSVAASGKTPASLAEAANVTTRWMEKIAGPIGGEGWKGFTLANHSGLSTRSRATPRQIASILRLGYQTFGETFTQLHAKRPAAGYQAFTVRGKSGTLRFVRGYSGFLTIGGREMIFAIMSNDERRRAMADAGVDGLGSGSWMRKARRLELAILSDWVEDFWPGQDTAPVAYAEVTVPSPVSPTLTPVASESGQLFSVTMNPVRAGSYPAPVVPQAKVSLANYVRATRPVE